MRAHNPAPRLRAASAPGAMGVIHPVTRAAFADAFKFDSCTENFFPTSEFKSTPRVMTFRRVTPGDFSATPSCWQTSANISLAESHLSLVVGLKSKNRSPSIHARHTVNFDSNGGMFTCRLLVMTKIVVPSEMKSP